MKKIALILFLTTLIAREPLRFLDEFVEGYFLVAKSKLESSPTVWQDVREGYIRSYGIYFTDQLLDSLKMNKKVKIGPQSNRKGSEPVK